MILAEAHLRRIIREALLSERSGVASASDIARFKPKLEEWVSVLLDEMAEEMPAMEEMSDKARKNMGSSLTNVVSVELVSLTSGMSYSSKKRIEKRAEEKSHQKWDKKRRAVHGSGANYYGEYGSS